jgi:hypothetical protein
MGEQPLTHKNSKFNLHKVFASVGLVMIGIILALAVIAYIYRGPFGDFLAGVLSGSGDSDVTKVATPSAKTATNSAETKDWKTYEFTYSDKKYSFQYPKDWSVKVNVVDKEANNIDYNVTDGTFVVAFWNNRARGSTLIGGDYKSSTVKVTFLGKEQDAEEKIAKDGKSWEIFPSVSINTAFSYNMYSSTTIPSVNERKIMLEVVSTFKSL